MIALAQFGAGQIGSIHGRNIAANPKSRLKYIVDMRPEAAQRLAAATGAQIADAKAVFADPEVKGVVIASATPTHADLAIQAAEARKAVFCEKPIDLDLARTDACLAAVGDAGIPFQIGFNRRFDPSFRAIHDGIAAGKIGKVELVMITSRDPAPDNEEYLKVSGGLFRDMTIHDFDMARFMLGEEPDQVFATGSCLIDPVFARLGDFDTVMVTLRCPSGRMCHINNSVRAVYGYDQRVEVFGSAGLLRAGNRTPTSVELANADGITTDKPHYFFLQRYSEAYAAEMDAFIDCIAGGRTPSPGAEDGRRAMLLAEAALASSKSGRFEKVRDA